MSEKENAALERRIDELCQENEQMRKTATMLANARTNLLAENAKLRAEVERLRAEQAHWELGNCPNCPNVVSLQEALEQNAKLREFTARLANALGIDSEWCDPEWCDSDCMDEFKCRPTGDYGEIHCPAFTRMTDLGIEVKE